MIWGESCCVCSQYGATAAATDDRQIPGSGRAMGYVCQWHARRIDLHERGILDRWEATKARAVREP